MWFNFLVFDCTENTIFAEKIRLVGLNLNCPEEDLSDDFGNCLRLLQESKLTLMVEKTIYMEQILKRFF